MLPISIMSHTILPIPPNTLFFLLAACFLHIYFDPSLGGTQLCIEKKQRKLVFAAIVYAIYIVLNQYYLGTSLRSSVGVVVSTLYLPLFLIAMQGIRCGAEPSCGFEPGEAETNAGGGQRGSVGGGLNRGYEELSKIISPTLLLSAIIYGVEAAYRYLSAILGSADESLQGIYKYKFGGLMYSDSNVTAIHLVLLLFFSLWCKEKKIKNANIYALVFAILLALTLSRACILSAIVAFVFLVAYKKREKIKLWHIAASALLLIFFISIVLYFFRHDKSLLSKISILNYFIEYLKQSSIHDILFGVGLGRSISTLGIYAHNYFFVLFVECGVIACILNIYLFIQTLITCGGKTLPLLIAFLLCTSIATTTYLPDLYLFLAIITYFSGRSGDLSGDPSGLSGKAAIAQTQYAEQSSHCGVFSGSSKLGSNLPTQIPVNQINKIVEQ